LASTVSPERCSIRDPCANCSGIRKEAPLDAEGHQGSVYFLTEKSKFKLPITPPPLARSRQLRHLAESLREVAGRQSGRDRHHHLHRIRRDLNCCSTANRVTGVRTDDKGVDKEGHQKSNFEPGYDLNAKVHILAEGPRGSLTKQLISKFDLMKDANPQTYGVGVKELWEVPSGRIAPGEVIYTMGWPLTTKRIRRRVDLRRQRQHRFARLRHRTRLSRPAA
jgi:electron-transferring-flavoprotein dehydrogenase